MLEGKKGRKIKSFFVTREEKLKTLFITREEKLKPCLSQGKKN